MTESDLLLAGLAGLAAGFLDSIVGGGGLIMTPAMLNLFPGLSILQVIGTQRTSSIFGTSVAAWNYLKHVSVPKGALIGASVAALLLSIGGVLLAKQIDAEALKWVVLAMCVALGIYTAFKKSMGEQDESGDDQRRITDRAILIGGACGFYNGLIGPGTGTLLVFGFVALIGFSFLRASALAKVSNVAADLASWSILAFSGFVVWKIAAVLIVGNVIGSYLGSRFAILKGSHFIRVMFLSIVVLLVGKLMWDLLRS
ncbi:MAG: TSUP family transporter [Ahniella sp.]|nr:TSUP family transporter [Ahniella sp.]